jgi:hypothetical protein
MDAIELFCLRSTVLVTLPGVVDAWDQLDKESPPSMRGSRPSKTAMPQRKVPRRAEPWEQPVAMIALLVGVGLVVYGIVLIYQVNSRPHANATVVRQLGCGIPSGGDSGLQCNYKVAFIAAGHPATAIIDGVNPFDVKWQAGIRHLEIYYEAGNPSKAGDLSNDAINDGFLVAGGLAVLALVCLAYFKCRISWRELRTERARSSAAKSAVTKRP